MIRIIAVGKIREKALQQCVEEYLKRLLPYGKTQVIEVQDEAAPAFNSPSENEKVKEKEGAKVLAKIRPQDYVIVLDLHGTMLDSVALAKKMETVYSYHGSDLTFVIGGSLGLSPALISRADFRWKLSDLTFTHQMTRLLVVEQIYRAYKIMNHEPYHK